MTGTEGQPNLEGARLEAHQPGRRTAERREEVLPRRGVRHRDDGRDRAHPTVRLLPHGPFLEPRVRQPVGQLCGVAASNESRVGPGRPPVSLVAATLLQFSTDDVRAEVETIRARGGRIMLEPIDTDWGTTSAYVAGPHNVLVELYQWST